MVEKFRCLYYIHWESIWIFIVRLLFIIQQKNKIAICVCVFYISIYIKTCIYSIRFKKINLHTYLYNRNIYFGLDFGWDSSWV